MKKYQRKPVSVDAIKFTGKNQLELLLWARAVKGYSILTDLDNIYINTLRKIPRTSDHKYNYIASNHHNPNLYFSPPLVTKNKFKDYTTIIITLEEIENDPTLKTVILRGESL